MKAAHERQERKAIQARADIQLARLDLRKLMEADKPDSKAIEAQIDRIAGLRAGLEKSRMATMLEFRASLTPEQQKKLRELRERGPQMRSPGATPQKKGGDM
jgi:Spy/CpxP family protein refolding chaperone